MLFLRVDTDRRRFLESVAMTIAGAGFGTFGRAYAADRARGSCPRSAWRSTEFSFTFG
jgi:hypothetical protein